MLLYHAPTYNEHRPGVSPFCGPGRRYCSMSRAEKDPPGRVLALDYGKRRIGLAVSDELGLTAQGLETFQRTRIRDDVEGLARIAADHGVSLILMGDPLHMSGRRGRQSENVREFAARLAKRTGLPVRFWDERLTTAEAERVLKQSGVSSRKRARAVDRLAAVILLESYLAWRAAHTGGPEGEE